MLYALERLHYRLAGKVSTISEGMRRKILGKSVPDEKTLLFQNLANGDTLRPGDRMEPLRAEWGLAESDFVVL